MPPELHTMPPIEQLRWLAASDPKRARAFISELLTGDKSNLESILLEASKPGDGRLRQVIAMVYRTQPDTAAPLTAWLKKWLAVESDEFTKTALSNALEPPAIGSDHRPMPRTSAANAVEAYRYVADRLCHRIRNALALPTAQMLRLEQLAVEATQPDLRRELLEVYEGLQAGLTRISRNVEFDTDDGYLAWQSIELIPWLERIRSDFSGRFGQSKLAVTCDQTVKRSVIRATPFLLETIFANIWVNAVQATDSAHEIDIQCAVDSRRSRIDLLVVDAGPGFPDAQLEIAFQQIFSTKGTSRGRGLLEIADAVARLQGTVQLAKDHHERYRIALSLPLEAS